MTVEAQKYQDIRTRLGNWWRTKKKEWTTEYCSYDSIAYWREFQYAESDWYGTYFRNLSSPHYQTLRPYVSGFSPLRFHLENPQAVAAVEIAMALKEHFKLSKAFRYQTRDCLGVDWTISVVNGYDKHDSDAKERGEFGIGIGESAEGKIITIIFPARYYHPQGYSAKIALDIKKHDLARRGQISAARELKIDPLGDFPAAIRDSITPISFAEFGEGLPRDPHASLRRFHYRKVLGDGYWEAHPLPIPQS